MEVTNEYIMRRLYNLSLADETLLAPSMIGSLTLYVNDRILLNQGYTEFNFFVIGKNFSLFYFGDQNSIFF